MSGPDLRGSTHDRQVKTMGLDDEEFGMDAPEDYTVRLVGGHRHFHLRGDVESSFTAGDDVTTYTYALADDLESEFKAQATLSEWNGQEIFDADNGVRESRAEYTALDTSFGFIVDSYGEPAGGEVEGEIDG